MSNLVRVLVADDHTVLRDGLKAAFEMDKNIIVVGEAANGEEVLNFVELFETDLIVMDISMPVMDGITAAKIIKEKYPHIKVLLLSMYDNKQFVLDALSSGIDGFILKMADMKKVFNAIHLIHSGETYFDADVTSQFKNKDVSGDTKTMVTECMKNVYKLTSREIEVLQLIGNGLTTAEIAEQLFLSNHTVNNYRQKILAKLNLKNTAEMVRFAIKEGVITL